MESDAPERQSPHTRIPRGAYRNLRLFALLDHIALYRLLASWPFLLSILVLPWIWLLDWGVWLWDMPSGITRHALWLLDAVILFLLWRSARRLLRRWKRFRQGIAIPMAEGVHWPHAPDTTRAFLEWDRVLHVHPHHNRIVDQDGHVLPAYLLPEDIPMWRSEWGLRWFAAHLRGNWGWEQDPRVDEEDGGWDADDDEGMDQPEEIYWEDADEPWWVPPLSQSNDLGLLKYDDGWPVLPWFVDRIEIRSRGWNIKCEDSSTSFMLDSTWHYDAAWNMQALAEHWPDRIPQPEVVMEEGRPIKGALSVLLLIVLVAGGWGIYTLLSTEVPQHWSGYDTRGTPVTATVDSTRWLDPLDAWRNGHDSAHLARIQYPWRDRRQSAVVSLPLDWRHVRPGTQMPVQIVPGDPHVALMPPPAYGGSAFKLLMASTVGLLLLMMVWGAVLEPRPDPWVIRELQGWGKQR